jgi:hypothetical protein
MFHEPPRLFFRRFGSLPKDQVLRGLKNLATETMKGKEHRIEQLNKPAQREQTQQRESSNKSPKKD